MSKTYRFVKLVPSLRGNRPEDGVSGKYIEH